MVGFGDRRSLETLLRRWPLLVGVAIALFGLDLLELGLPSVSAVTGPARWLRLLGPHWLVAAVILAVVVWYERRAFASIGLTRPTARELGWGLIGFVGGVVAFGVTRPLIQALGLSSTVTGIATIAALPTWVAVALALTAGVTEEVLFRGYPIERLGELTGSLRVGAAVTVVVFTAAHVPFWGLGGALQIGVWTLVVTALYVRTRNLPACMLMHVANDLFAFVLLPILFDAGTAV